MPGRIWTESSRVEASGWTIPFKCVTRSSGTSQKAVDDAEDGCVCPNANCETLYLRERDHSHRGEAGLFQQLPKSESKAGGQTKWHNDCPEFIGITASRQESMFSRPPGGQCKQGERVKGQSPGIGRRKGERLMDRVDTNGREWTGIRRRVARNPLCQ